MLALLLASGCLINQDLYDQRYQELSEGDDTACTPVSVWVDADGDGWGTSLYPDTRCGDLTGWATRDGDCDDADGAINPDAAELCATAADDDCDGAINEEGAADGEPLYADTDGDSFGDASALATVCGTDGWVTDATDCDDGDDAVHPGATEVCNTGVDEDCDAGTTCRLEGEVSARDADVTLYGAVRDDFGFPSVVGDMSGDGLDDIAITDQTGFQLLASPADGARDIADDAFLTLAPDDVSPQYLRAVGADLDGDGVRDLAISAYGDDFTSSAVFVFNGGGTAPITTDDAWIAWEGVSWRALGFSLAPVDDMNGDGLQEVLVGSVSLDGLGVNNVSLYQPGTSTSLSDAILSIDGPEEMLFAYNVASGDIDGDRFPDLVVASPSETGAIYVFYGPILSGGWSYMDADVVIAGSDGAVLGDITVFDPILDANGDGEGDLLVGAVGVSSAYLFEGPLASSLTLADAAGTYVGDGRFGAMLSGGDADGDDRHDILLGWPDSATGQGAFLFYGPAFGTHNASEADVRFLSEEDSGHLALFPGDLDGDGFDEVLTSDARVSTLTLFRGSGL